MNSETSHTSESSSADDVAVRALYAQMLTGWNQRSGDTFAAPFAEDGEVVGFDGSQVAGQAEIASVQQRIFADHPTAAYVWKVKDVGLLAPDVAILRAIAGMVRPGQSDIEPQLNSIQTVVAAKRGGQWRIVHFQNTPAQFHGRPELVRQMTAELQEQLGTSR